ncbi:MAG: hypothetical protein H7123_04025, partial [Thermoleophilia bacterium]|nr:hypothetical protein [Thermoleophilia bacterium]
MTAVLQDRLEALADIPLLGGGHDPALAGKKMCAMEAVAWLAGEPGSASPQCADPILSGIFRRWNDRMATNEDRERLKPLLPKLAGTRSTPAVENERRR